MKLPMQAALCAASLALALPALATNEATRAVAPRKVDPAALELVRLAPLPQAKSAGDNPLRPRLPKAQPVTKTLETRVRFDPDGAPLLDCIETDGHAHPHVDSHPAAEAGQ
jgi:hypothetical protein